MLCEEPDRVSNRLMVVPRRHHERGSVSISLVRHAHHVDGVIPRAAGGTKTHRVSTPGSNELLGQAGLLFWGHRVVANHKQEGVLTLNRASELEGTDNPAEPDPLGACYSEKVHGP